LLGDSGIIGNYYFFIDDYEESIFIIHYLTDKDLFIDVGSNHGHYTMIASGICDSKSISIEPVEKTFDRLKMNIGLNNLKNVKLFNIGISDTEGELFISNNMGSMNRIIKRGLNDNCELIKVTTLDKLLISEKNISLIKIDVEGYEKQVLLGCTEILKNPNLNVIIIELNDSNQQYDYNETETISILKENGFLPYKYIYPDNLLVPLEKKNFDSYNTIFIKDINFVKNKIKQKSVTIDKNTIVLD
jgi:FkbM family methyltransferase